MHGYTIALYIVIGYTPGMPHRYGQKRQAGAAVRPPQARAERPRKDRAMAARETKPTTTPTAEPVVQHLPIDKVIPPSQNRDDLGDMEQLVASVKARGVAQAILVRPKDDGTYQIVFGE